MLASRDRSSLDVFREPQWMSLGTDANTKGFAALAIDQGLCCPLEILLADSFLFALLQGRFSVSR